jgi:hypothetical protein
MVLTLGIGADARHPTFVTIRASAPNDSDTREAGRRLDGHWQPHPNGSPPRQAGLPLKNPHEGREIGAVMGLMDDAKDTAEATGKKVGEWVDDTKERVSDKVDEVKADADLKAAEAHKDAVDAKNEYKEDLRSS